MRSGLRRVLRQALVAVALAAVVVVCLRMGWWQLERYLSAGGSLQNLGYTLQWPTFAVFAVVAWWRLRRLERARTAAAEAEAATEATDDVDSAGDPDGSRGSPALTPSTRTGGTRAGTGAAGTVRPGHPAVVTAAADGEPDGPDDELAAYNRYLAGLNAAAERKKS